MTDLLKKAMHDRADSLAPPVLDVAAIVSTVERRVRRRRTAAAGCVAALAVAAAVAGPSLLTSPDRAVESPSFASTPAALDPVWASGSTIHVADRTLEVDDPVLAMATSTAGVVWSDASGAVWSAVGDTAPTRMGTTVRPQTPRLASDESLVAWLERDEAELPVYAVLDQTTGRVTRSNLSARAGMNLNPDDVDPAVVYAVDGQEVYLRDQRGLVAWNPTTDAQRVLGDPVALALYDVEDRYLAHGLPQADGGERSIQVGRTLGDGETLDVRDAVDLSPDGAHLLAENRDGVVVVADTVTGELVTPTAPGYAHVAGYHWVDDDTFLALGLVAGDWASGPADVLSCEVDGGCSVVVEAAGSIADGLVVAIGTPMG